MPRQWGGAEFRERYEMATGKDHRRRKVTDEHRAKIARLSERGLSMREIARRMAVSHSTIATVLQGMSDIR